MSKGNNSFDSDAYLMHSMQELIAGSFKTASNEFSKTLGDEIRRAFSNEYYAKDRNNLTAREIDKALAIALSRLEKIGVKFEGDFKKEMQRQLNAVKKYASSPTGNVSQTEITNKLIKDIETLLKASQDASRKGEELYFKNVSSGKIEKEILKEIKESLYGKRNGFLGKIDDTTEKLLDFLGEQKKEAKKDLKNLGKDLLEGLEKSKFVGGALSDTFKLLGLLGASWLSQFGQLGRILGGAFYIAMATAGPLLVSLLLKGMGKLIPLAFRGGFNLIKGLFKGGGKLGTFFSAGAGGVAQGASRVINTPWGPMVDKAGVFAKGASNASNASKALRVGKIATGAVKGIGGLVAGLALEAGANKAVDLGANAKLAHGLSGAGQGAITGAMLGSVIPVIGTGVGAAIGTVVGGLSGVIKGHFIDQRKKQDELLMIQNENKGFWKNLLDWLKNSKLGKWLSGDSSSGGGSSRNSRVEVPYGAEVKSTSARADEKGARTIGNLKVAKDGSVLNISDMTQDQASAALQAYEKADPTGFNNVYEWADAGHASLGSFQTDAVKKVNGKKTGALMYKGASSDLDALRDSLIKAGMDPSKANALAFTSGRMTGSNTRHSGKGKWKSHDNQYGLGFDLGAGGKWSQEDYDEYMGMVKQFYADRGFDVYYEKAGQGKSSGMHFDVKPHKNIRTPGAIKNLEDQKAIAEKHSITAMDLVQKLEGTDRMKEIGKGNYSKSQEEFGKLYEDELKKYGISSVKGADGKDKWVYQDGKSSREFDPTGSLDFIKKQMTYMTNNNQ